MRGNETEKQNASRGFTLVEVLVAVGIFVVISSVLLVRNSKFNSETLLENTAYEMALSIREAQVYGLSVREAPGTSELFETSYGVRIGYTTNNLVSPTTYIICTDVIDLGIQEKICNAGIGDLLQTITIRNGIYVKSICGYSGGGSTCDAFDKNVDIYFNRPDPEAIISRDTGPYQGHATGDIDAVEITLSSRDDSNQRIIKVTNTGQISVF